jgi:imidazole glycerol phosphate synthase glutamine amidotransferase subunit
VTKAIIGVLDYGIGNTLSVRNILSTLGYRSRLVSQAEQMDTVSVLIIPGVGAFPAAMQQLNKLGLVDAVTNFARAGKGTIGICLGMQLLADLSCEQGKTDGLGLIPGEVKPIKSHNWHIGWNEVNVIDQCSSLVHSHGRSFYFNHSYEFCTQANYIVGVADIGRPLVAVIQKDNIIGFQFHPEKSQQDGLRLINNSIRELLDA